ncbi:MAG: ATP-binding cassette domain-containing protein [Coriobacteriia bacterium]|nr:ATP-binding cassette domain-containing protein [Coriobacteriia bacterium]MCL2749945.1 ATP-binding cassette domain-containing protein [Coriobacteriia bacterium]
MANILTLNNVSYAYEGASKNVLQGMSADFETGRVYTIIGKSGAGKSTLLSLLSGLDVTTNGAILFDDKNLKKLCRDTYRAQQVGVIFQSYNLLTNATAVQNIVLSMNISESPERDKKAFAYALLAKVGIDSETADRKILKLSGGEQQRVAIARALAHNPAILIADEPTGNLDKDTEDDILHIFTKLAHEENRCVIIVTHSKRVTAIADVVYRLKDGRLAVV